MNKKVLKSLLTIGVVAGIGVGATVAFFNDEETTTGNVLGAGAVELKIDNESYYNGEVSDGTTWDLADLDDGDGPANGSYLFFDFHDLKPGDHGEDTIGLNVESNEAWVCANIKFTEAGDGTMTDPELDVDTDDGTWGGELDDNLYFMFWADDGDNVLEDDEQVLMEGWGSAFPQGDTGNDGRTYPIADATFGNAVTGGETCHIGKAWCFGSMNYTPLGQDDSGDARDPINNPFFTCDGQAVGNESQTDTLVGDIKFYAVQTRHNENFSCENDWTPWQ